MPTHHVFISYAHIDNLPLSEEQQGWISRFHNTLEVFLSQRLGGRARIWRDLKLQGNDIFGDEIVHAFRDAALFLSVLTPRYVRSDWCKREIHEFCEHAASADGLILENKSRVFKVIKTPVDRGTVERILPPVVRNSLGYEFFVQDEQGPMELDPDFGETFKQDYLRKVCILANNAAQMIQRFETEKVGLARTHSEAAAALEKKTVIFLASCSFDLRDQRELIEADLRSHGYKVLPEQRLPAEDEAEHIQAVAALLEQAHLSLHLVGSGYGAVPDGPSHQSLVEIQNSMAADRSASHGLPRLIWLPQGTQGEQPDQVRFLTTLRRQAAPQRGADLIDGTLENLRTVLHASLDRLENPSPLPPEISSASSAEPNDTAPAGRMLYLICVATDRKATLPLRKLLKAEGWEVSLPAFAGDASALRETHEDMLRNCRAVLIFYGAGDEAWHRSVAMDLLRAPAYRDGLPLPPTLTYLAAPSSDDKDDMVEMEEPNLVDGREGFDPALLQPLLASLHATAASP
ncbi:TIR domain-containing protein [Microcystis elabens FACHB-917]|nr:TIR domain-containing protein [Microcystis elabens FACHB-917]